MKDVLIKDVLAFLQDGNYQVDYNGDLSLIIHNYSDLSRIQNYSIAWIKNKKYLTAEVLENIKQNQMAVIVCPWKIEEAKNCLVTESPKEVYFSILKHFFIEKKNSSISSNAIVETDIIGKNVSIGPGCYICKDVIINDDVVLHANVVIECPCKIGKGTEIFSGAIIGADGFGYYYHEGVPERVPHFGGVIIGDCVDIGANSCIDRGCLGYTIIGNNVKIDRLCHIAHNVIIGNNTLITGGSSVSGSTIIGENVYIAPCSVILNQLSIKDNAYIGMGSVVIRNVKQGEKVFGNPARKLNV